MRLTWSHAIASRQGAPAMLPRAATAPVAVDALITLRVRHPSWGRKQLVAIPARRQRELPALAPSTAAALLERHGCMAGRHRRRALGRPGPPQHDDGRTERHVDRRLQKKRQFKTGDGRYCYPLTIVDGASRFLLACRALTSVRNAEAGRSSSGSSAPKDFPSACTVTRGCRPRRRRSRGCRR